MQKKCVDCELRTGSLNIIQLHISPILLPPIYPNVTFTTRRSGGDLSSLKGRKYSRAPLSVDQYPQFQLIAIHRGPKKFGKLKKQTVRKFQNSSQARTGRNMVKSSSLNTSSILFIFFCPRTHASPQNLSPICF
jgi:hypothetical protein